MSAPSTSRFDVLLPYVVRRSVIAAGEGGATALARGEVAGRPAEVVGDRARLELRRGAEVAVGLLLQDWTAEARGELPPMDAGTEAWRFTVTLGGAELAADVAKVKRGRSPLADATRYWRVRGEAGTWFWGNGPEPAKGSRSRVFHLWRGEPDGDPLVVVTITAVGEDRVESVVSAVGGTARTEQATDAEEELAVLLAVGGFQVELVGRNERIGKAAKWLADVVVDDVTGPPYR